MRSGPGIQPAAFADPPPARKPWGPLRVLATIVVIVIVALALAAVTIYMLVVNSFNQRPAAVSAPIAWKSGAVVLSAEHPTSAGYLSVFTEGSTSSSTVVGVNAGLPLAAAPAATVNVDPASLLTIPAVQFSATTRGQVNTQTCFAPCELIVRSALDCTSGACRLHVDIKLELIPASAPNATNVTVGLSGAIAGDFSNPLPQGTRIEFAADGSPDGS